MNAAPNWKPAPALRSPEWLAYVRSLPSVQSGSYGCIAHHTIGHGRLSTLKTSDFFAIPLTDAEHKALHDGGWLAWEADHGDQYDHALTALRQGITDGVLNWKVRPIWEDMTAQQIEAEIQLGYLILDKRAARYIAA